jgi:glycosyltransferase involved in cell wall biosynthesis
MEKNTKSSIGKQNRFKIITPSYNNEEWVEYNIASILNQTYKNYEVLYVDDHSTDNTYSKVLEVVGHLPNWKVVSNQSNKGALSNYFDNLDFVEDDDILIHLDGDDWLYDENVLQKLNDFYNKEDCWMTYGGFLVFEGEDKDPGIPYPQSTEYPDFIHRYKKYRLDLWRPSHMRTYRGFLIKSVNRNDLKDLIENKDYWHASDLAFQYPCLEMCSKDRIKVIDFYAHVYNQSKTNKDRTKERESVDNSKYEIEIRKRKQYKEGMTGEKLPQINVYPVDYYSESHSIPTKFTYVYGLSKGEYDMTILYDTAINDYIEGRINLEPNKLVVAYQCEQRSYFQNKIFENIKNHYNKFDCVLTYDKDLLSSIPNAKFLPSQIQTTQFNRLPNPLGQPPYSPIPGDTTYELPLEIFKIYPKNKIASAVASNKSFLPGHVKRLDFINTISNKVDLFGRGTGREVLSKLDALKDYMFSVAIENSSEDDYYFTEKIVDCFLTGTVPIYYGCPHIAEFFDIRGILTFKDSDELSEIINNLSEDKYKSMLPYIEYNFNKCFTWPLNNDMLYDMYYKTILNYE